MVLKDQRRATKKKPPIPKSQRNWAKIKSLAGAWADLDTEAMKKEIYRRRRESVSPPRAL